MGTPKGERYGGRKKGTPNKRTAKLVAKIESEGITPLQYVLGVLRDPNSSPEDRRWASATSLPYTSARLQTTTVKEDPEQFAKRTVDLDMTETARRIAFILTKASRSL